MNSTSPAVAMEDREWDQELFSFRLFGSQVVWQRGHAGRKSHNDRSLPSAGDRITLEEILKMNTSGIHMDFLQYTKSSYIDRPEAQEKLFSELQNMMMLGEQSNQTVFHFFGISGMGKTWLLKNTAEVFSSINTQRTNYPVLCFYFSFKPDQAYTFAAFIQSFLSQLAEQTGATPTQDLRTLLDSDTTNLDITSFILSLIRFLASSQYSVLFLLDNVDEIHSEAWYDIESQFLEPIINQRCIIASTGRHDTTRWSKSEIIRKMNDTKGVELLPFNDKQVREQLLVNKHQKLQRWYEEITRLSAGIPCLVDLLAENITTWLDQIQKKSETSLITAFGNEIDQLLDRYLAQVAPGSVLKDLAPIYLLRENHIGTARYMLTNLQPELKNKPEVHFLVYLRTIVSRTDVFWLDSEMRAYAISRGFRALMDGKNLLQDQLGKSDQYTRLHQVAVEMYWEWARQTPKVSEKHLIEILFHLSKLQFSKKNKDHFWDCIKEVLHFAQNELVSRRYPLFRKAFLQDSELREILPADALTMIQEQLAENDHQIACA